MEAFATDQRRIFVEEVKKITAYNAANGKLQSGGTIKEVCRLMEKFLKGRAEEYKRLLNSLPLKPSKTIAADLNSVIEKYFDDKYSDFRDEYQKVISIANASENAVVAANDIANTVNKSIAENVKLETQQELMNIDVADSGSKFSKPMLALEGLLLLVTAFLAGMWAADQDGNYEPFIVITTALLGLLELMRRFLNAKA